MDKREINFSKIGYYCFYAGVVIEVLMVIVDKSAYTNPIEGRLFQLTFLLFLIKVCSTRYTLKEYLTIGLFCALGLVSDYVTERNEIIRLVMFVAACKNIDMQRCLKLVFYMTLAGCAAIVLLSLTGIYGAASLTKDFGRGSVETRYTLGMGHPNALQCMVWALSVLGLYLYGERMRWYHFFGVLVLNGISFLLTDSKTGTLVAFFSIFLFGVIRISRADWLRRLIFAGGTAMTAGCIVSSVFMAKDAILLYRFRWEWYWNEKVEFYRKLDALLTGRINSLVGTENFEGTTGTWSLFSRPENTYYFDLGWVRLFYWYGIIPAGIFIILILLLMLFCYCKKQDAALVLIISFTIYTLIEAHGISVYIARNYVFFLLGAYWSGMLCWRKEEQT